MNTGMPAGLASLVLQLQALFTIALAMIFLAERPRPAQLLGAAVAVAGIAVIGAGRAHSVPVGSLVLCIAAAASWGVGNICNRQAQAQDAFALLVWSSLVAPLPLYTLSLILEGPQRIGHALSHLQPGGILALLYVVIVSTAFGFGAWTWLLRRHPASRVAPFTLLVPPVGIATAWIALGERPGAAELAGALVVLVGLTLVTSSVRARPARVNRLPSLETPTA
jgi:O-acetylserine/cysteine efflux transporter